MRPALPVVALGLVVSCVAAHPPPVLTVASSPEPALDGRPLHPDGLNELTRTRYWDEVQSQRAERAPTGGTSREALAAWLRQRVEGLRRLHPLIAQLNARTPDDALFAAVLYGRTVDELRAEVEALPRLDGVQADQESLWRTALSSAATPLLRGALDAWRRCAAVAPRTASILHPWGPVCAAQAEVLAARLVASESTRRPRGPAAPAVPPEGEGPELQQTPVDPEAPVPAAPPTP